jgi:hypothetical protein
VLMSRGMEVEESGERAGNEEEEEHGSTNPWHMSTGREQPG